MNMLKNKGNSLKSYYHSLVWFATFKQHKHRLCLSVADHQ